MVSSNCSYLIIIVICLHTVIWFQVFLSNTNNFLNRSIWPTDGTLTDTSTPSQNGPGSNGDEGIVHIPQSFRTGTSLPDF